jgi:tRNA dimethylallyltransferase
MKAAAEIRAAPGLPILVGGTGLYVRALIDGLADIPKIPPEVRARAQEKLRAEGNHAFHTALIARDPASARLNAGDTQRILRAYEVLEATGVPLTHWQTRAATPPLYARYFKIVLMPDRADLYAACDARFLAMMARGAGDEVKALLDRGILRDAPILKVLGAAPLAAHLAGEMDRDEAITLAQTATRQYAKRQVTWFRHQFQADLCRAPGDLAGLVADVLPRVRSFAAASVVDKS